MVLRLSDRRTQRLLYRLHQPYGPTPVAIPKGRLEVINESTLGSAHWRLSLQPNQPPSLRVIASNTVRVRARLAMPLIFRR